MKTIYYNGKVYTGELPLVTAFAVENGKFVFAGSDREASQLVCRDDKVVDLEGHFVCAAFNDSHMHVLNLGTSLRAALLAQHTDSLEGMIEYLKDFYAQGEFSDTNWLFGRGWNQDFFSDADRMPTRYDLDKVTTDVPVMIVRCCGHAAVINTKLMDMIGITSDTPSPEGGSIGMEDGVPDGRLFDGAMGLAYSLMPSPDKDEVKRRLESAFAFLNSYGVASAQTDDLSRNWKNVIDAYKELEKEGKMTVRICEQSNFGDVDEFKSFMAQGYVTGAGSDMFKIGPLKMLGDGALGARTAYLSVPYADDPSTYGIPVYTQKQLDDMVDAAVVNNMQVAIHAIGDACLDRVLSAYEKAFDKYHPEDHRCGIVHCQITRPDQLKKIADMKLHVYMQSIFLDYDTKIVEARCGKELASTSYSWKTLKDMGVTVSNGTDCPVELPFAMGGIQCLVTRKTLDGFGPYLPDQAFSLQEAIDSYTKVSAYSSFDENKKGQIKAGMLADFVILEENPFDIPAETLKDDRVLATYLGGKEVWKRGK